jgi:hypothetical protein
MSSIAQSHPDLAATVLAHLGIDPASLSRRVPETGTAIERGARGARAVVAACALASRAQEILDSGI